MGGTAQRVNTNVNYGLQLVTVYQYQFIKCNICTTLMLDVNKKGNFCRGEGVYGNSLYFLLKFSINLKLLKKNKVYSFTKLKKKITNSG